MLRPRQLVVQVAVGLTLVILTIIALRTPSSHRLLHADTSEQTSEPQQPQLQPPRPKYKPEPSFTPPPIADPFPALATSAPPPIPAYNVPEKDAWRKYGLDIAPPLLIGFTRSYPMLLQTVVSYITAGWPPEHIYVVENTGAQQANSRGRLTLQHPLFLNHAALHTLGVNIVQTPVLLSFAQLQNFYLSLSYTHQWPYYFWSHMDVLALGHEDGLENHSPRAGEPGYKSLYTLCIEELNRTLATDTRWATRFFAYDWLTLTNPRAVEDVNGWDTMIPYYMTDCDFYSRLDMRNWTQRDGNCGVITDTSSTLEDLRALYRDPNVVPRLNDPNPPPPQTAPEEKKDKRHVMARQDESPPPNLSDPVEYWKALKAVADSMFHYKHGDRGRNTWQAGQHGGMDEPFYYNNAGFTEALEILTEAGKEVYRRKWGHQDCQLIGGGGLKFDDQWRVEKDW
ncbi:hypothetical protein F5Y18DRAFT_158771 [Xylariaceae sp. FL1019]|nr:hypothetical protein F5Y18DRAFT_158771 [Xylariaceae sp. FL1019]